MTTATMLMNKHPGRFPIIIHPKPNTKTPEISKHNYLVSGDMTMAQFTCVLRQRIKLKAEQAIFIFVDNTLVPNNTQISELYMRYADSDKFLYMIYACEATFGAPGRRPRPRSHIQLLL